MNIPERVRHEYNRTIFCIVDSPELEDAIEKCAEEINCEVLFDLPHSPELILEQHFLSIVDGNIIHEGVWDMYVEFCNDGNIQAPCLLIDNKDHLQIPENCNVYKFESDDYDEIINIVDTIKKIKSDIFDIYLN